MEAVDELEAERDEKGDGEQQVGEQADGLGAGRLDLVEDAVGGEEQPDRHDGAEDDEAHRAHRLVEVDLALVPRVARPDCDR